MRHTIASSTVRAQLRPWPRDPTICHLALLDVNMAPTLDDVETWVDQVFSTRHGPLDGFDEPPTRIRTGALFPAAARSFVASGFVEVDRLALLERSLPVTAPGNRAPAPDITLRRLRTRALGVAAIIDELAFGSGWSNNADTLDEIAHATPQARMRLAFGPGDRPSRRTDRGSAGGFSITGRAGPTAYLQRLAVRPDARRHGIARGLIDDSIAWSTRRGATRLLVNTGVANTAALTLYERFGFRRLDDKLVVLERHHP